MGLRQLVSHRVKEEKATKAEKRAMLEQVEAFDTAVGRLEAFGRRDPVIGPMGRTDIDQLILAATKGSGMIAIPRVKLALQNASALRSAHPAGATIDPASGLTTTDLDLVAATASDALLAAVAAADDDRHKRLIGFAWAGLVFVFVAGVIFAIIRGV